VVPIRRFDGELLGKLARDDQRLFVGGDAVRVRVEFKSWRLLRDRDRPGDIFLHGGS
jgi:hypothetical protein